MHLVECYLAFFIPLVQIVLPEHFEYRVTLGRHLRDEPGYVVEPSHKALNFLLGSGRGQVLYCSYFFRINFDSFISNINGEMVGFNPAFLPTVPRPSLGRVVGCRKHGEAGRGRNMRHGWGHAREECLWLLALHGACVRG